MSSDSSTAPKSLRLVLSLGIIAMMSGFLVVLAFQLTAPRIAANQQAALENAVFSVLPSASGKRNFILNQDGIKELANADAANANLYLGYDSTGALVGCAMEASARGYQDVVKLLYGYSIDSQCVIGITILQSTETPGLGDKVESDPAFLDNFECLDASLSKQSQMIANPIITVKNGHKSNPWEIDGISGATVTSTAIGNALRESTTQMLPLIAKHRNALPQSFSEGPLP